MRGRRWAVCFSVGGARRSGSGKILGIVLQVFAERGRQLLFAGAVIQTPQLFGVAVHQAPLAADFVVAAKLVTGGRIIARLGTVAHRGQLRLGEELQLPHPKIIAYPTRDTRPLFAILLCQFERSPNGETLSD